VPDLAPVAPDGHGTRAGPSPGADGRSVPVPVTVPVPGTGQPPRGDDRDPTISASLAAERHLPGWPGPGEAPPGPPIPVPTGRGGIQQIPRPRNARAGGPPPWASVAPDDRRPTLATVRAALDAQGPPRPSIRELTGVTTRAAAVLAPLYDGGDGATVVLTRRTWTLRSHRGEVSFPGGRAEPGESPLEAATREAHEEIALDPRSVEVIGELDHLATITSDSFIVPLVGALPGRPETRPNPGEVDAILHVPLAELLDPAIFREEVWTFPDGDDRHIYFFELVGDTLWGATAAMLRQLLGMVTGTLGRGDLGHP
jgi:8-oxo-dGTP pyrophosphatase MutT (NUDIX family)